jgi:hypothetical protein
VQRDRGDLPSWYHRVQDISFVEDREVRGYDIDEDLSDLEEEKGQEEDDAEQLKNEDCECGEENPRCDCKIENGSDVDEEYDSERSYDGSDADEYYELKEEREERKEEKLRERKEKDRQRDIERAKEEEGRVAYESLKKAEREGKPIPVGVLAGQSFRLFCGDHVDHFSHNFYRTKRVEFYYMNNMDIPHPHKSKPGMLYGDVYLDAEANCGFGPFLPPKRASRKALKVNSDNGMYELSFKFIGNGYLKLRVPGEMALLNPRRFDSASPAAAPKVFEFIGIWRDIEKEKMERWERLEKAPKCPSPRES